MWSGLGHCIILYMGVNTVEEHSEPSSTGHREMGAVCPDRKIGTHQSDCMGP